MPVWVGSRHFACAAALVLLRGVAPLTATTWVSAIPFAVSVCPTTLILPFAEPFKVTPHEPHLLLGSSVTM